MNVAALVFGAQIFRIESSSWRILPLMSMKCPSLSFLMTLGWKSILLDIRMATPACFFRPFAWKIVFQPFTLRQCLSFSLRWVSCQQQKVGSCFCSQSVSLCHFIGELSLLILRDIKEKYLLLPVIFVVRVGFCSCGCLPLGLLKAFFLFLGCIFCPSVGIFPLLFCHGILRVLRLW